MNTKKKHKNRPKPTNPNPKESEVKVEKKTEDLISESDTTPAPITEVTFVGSLEVETPKKPKRNKGKKKNDDTDTLEENDNIREVVHIEKDEIKPVVVDENKDQDQDKSADAGYVTPSARKKKNKKKNHEQTKSEPEHELLPTAAEETHEHISEVVTEMKECVTEKEEEFKIDPKLKKKNKKKKRNDSERSDRSVEVVSCTSAFQQFLTEDKKPVLEETETKSENISSDNIIIALPAPDNLMKDSCNIADEVKECAVVKSDAEASPEQSKNKKKHKKDKKHAIEEPKLKTTADEKEDLSEAKLQLAVPEVLKEQIVEKEVSPKPKAKIAKPVDKKQKTQQDPVKESITPSTEELNVVKDDILAVETPPFDSISPHEQIDNIIKLEETSKNETKSIIETKSTPQPDDTMSIPSDKDPADSKSTPLPTNTINVPENKTKDKKRKKSPKPPSNSESEIESKEKVVTLPKTEPTTDIKSDTLKEDTKINIVCTENVSLTTVDEPFIPLQKSEKADELPPLLKIEEPFSDSKTEKKKKKTPKTPASFDMTENIESKQLVTPEVTESKIIPDLTLHKVATPKADVEIQSTKVDELDGSSCDVTPDVHFIRASSQQLSDSNNNMVVHEVRSVEEAKSSDSLAVPILEGSGETPTTSPDIEFSSLRKTEIKSEIQEPTYLKSKIMEVNQDMEDLRKSIERSLAEFSSLEKSEDKAEKDFERRIESRKTLEDIDKCVVETPEEKIIPQVQMSLPVTVEKKASDTLTFKETIPIEAPPVCPTRKDNKGKSKSKKKGKETASSTTSAAQGSSVTSSTDSKEKTKDKQDQTEQKTETDTTENKGKQQTDTAKLQATDTPVIEDSNNHSLSEQSFADSLEKLEFAPIENFEDALTSSIDDVNKTFEMIADDVAADSQKILADNKPEINITAPVEDTAKEKEKDDKINPVSQPKNFLGHNDIPAQSNKTDYKKEKNKTPNERQARVKIKDATDVEAKKLSKESQTEMRTKKQNKSEKETYSRVKNDNEEYVYKYSFRKVFLQSACHVCHKELVQTRVPCGFCSLVFYCSPKHKDEDWTQHQALCFAVSTIAHLKDQKHIYADAQNVIGQEYRLLRMQMIVSCEKVLKRRLVPWEQEAMLYPRVCADPACRQWNQAKLKDCEGCGQISYCTSQPSHHPKSHQRWCKSYLLYSKLVGYQQTRGRLEPRLPTKVMQECRLAEKMNEVLAAMYEEKIDMNDIQYAALTQLATAPLTAAHCYQLCKTRINTILRKRSFTIHVVGAELQFEADALGKWEVFYLHTRPDIEEIRVVLISPVLNPGQLPLDLLAKIRLCDKCRKNRRRVSFSFQDKKTYAEYRSSEDFVSPDLVCAFNPNIQRSSIFNGKDPWPAAINCILKQKIPFIITGYTLAELRQDLARVRTCSEVDFKVVSEPAFNNFASVRPDRNFISDDQMPLLFKNYCVTVLFGC